MNNLPIISSYEIRTSRTEQKVPVVNGVHLHSIYNPFKEAESLIESHLEVFKNKNEVLILGLGFGYHVNFAIEKLQELYGDNFKIIVIDPNRQVYEDGLRLDLINKKNLLIYSGYNSKELYSDLDLIHFLLRKPAMIAHPASFNLYQVYFKDFLTFEAPTKIEDIIKFSEVNEVKKYLSSLDKENTFDEELFKNLPQKDHFSKMDFLAMALVEMTKGSTPSTEGGNK
ncbi:MAG: hypothetical protein HOP07_10685 [Bacteriovoracaceae bacterium]|nr:hypothetical protein [Bacteriovoracaceae bacterium]